MLWPLEGKKYLDLTYIQFYHKFLFSNDYFRILKCCIGVDVHVEFFFKYIPHFNLNHTPISDDCLYLPVTMETVANK